MIRSNRACKFIKKETLSQVFFCGFCENSKNTFFTEHLWTIASDHHRTNLLKKRLWHRCFPVNFAKIRRTRFFTEHIRWLLLDDVWSIAQISPDLNWSLLQKLVLVALPDRELLYLTKVTGSLKIVALNL